MGTPMYGKRRISIDRQGRIGFGGKYAGDQGGSWQWIGIVRVMADKQIEVRIYGKVIAIVKTKTEAKIAAFHAAKASPDFFGDHDDIDAKGRIFKI
jgi:hypothetical protein